MSVTRVVAAALITGMLVWAAVSFCAPGPRGIEGEAVTFGREFGFVRALECLFLGSERALR